MASETLPANTPAPTLPAAAQAAVERAASYAASASAPATRRAYRTDWAAWEAWCATAGVSPLPATPAALGTHLAALADQGRKVATIARRLAAIATAHRHAGQHLDTRHPAVRDVLRGIRREHGAAPRQAKAATTAVVKALVETCDNSRLGLRDRAVILFGFASALRRSELVALTVEDLEFSPEGVKLSVRKSKTDQEQWGELIGVAATGTSTCPVAALRAWLDRAGITSGALFRSLDRHGNLRDGMTGEAVAMAVQRRAALAGLDPTKFSAHSLRAGLATTAAASGHDERDIQRQTRHRSVAVLRGYVRHGSVFLRNVSGAVGL